MTRALMVAEERGTPDRIQLGGAGAMKQTIEDLNAVRAFVASAMINGQDFGVIPGTGKKSTLLLPGAQKALMYFNVYPDFDVETRELESGHVEYIVKTHLRSRVSQSLVGSGLGSCSTMESKYRWRSAVLKCPQCGKGAIIKGKQEYGGGWVCFKRKDGCGAKFDDSDPAIVSQPVGKTENPDIYDQRNTVLKMAKKRSLVDSAHGLGCMSELFTQDLEDFGEILPAYTADEEPEPPPRGRESNTASRPTNRRRQEPFSPNRYKATPGDVRAFTDAVHAYCDSANAYWADQHTDDYGSLTVEIKDLVSPFQLVNHTLKHFQVTFDKGEGKHNERQRAGASLWVQDPRAVESEWKRYARELATEAAEKLRLQSEAEDGQGEAESQEMNEQLEGATAVREPGCDDDL